MRPVDDFAAGHLPGAISVALDGGSFATRAAFVLGPGEPVVAARAARRRTSREATRLLHAVGLFEQRGYVLGGDGRTRRRRTVSVAELARLLDGDADVQVLDVREPGERDGQRDPGCDRASVPRGALRAAGGLDRARPVYTICASGPRATLAASVLARRASTPARRSAAVPPTSRTRRGSSPLPSRSPSSSQRPRPRPMRSSPTALPPRERSGDEPDEPGRRRS